MDDKRRTGPGPGRPKRQREGEGMNAVAAVPPSTNGNGTSVRAVESRTSTDLAQQLTVDPPAWEEGYASLRRFVLNSLDVHRAELWPLLLPVFVQSYMDLLVLNLREAADHLLAKYAEDHEETAPATVKLLKSLRLPRHVSEDDYAKRWRNELYTVTVSSRGWALLLTWLQGANLAMKEGAYSSTSQTTGTQGRDRVLAIINERVHVIVVNQPPGTFAVWQGFESEVLPPEELPAIKLGIPPLDVKLQREVSRVVHGPPKADAEDKTAEQAAPAPSAAPEKKKRGPPRKNPLPAAADAPAGQDRPTSLSIRSSRAPTAQELPPYPTALRRVDVMREVEKLRSERARLRLSSDAFNVQKSATTNAHKPSVCIFTLHDTQQTATATRFSLDGTYLAVGSSNSYIHLWSMKGEHLEPKMANLTTNESTAKLLTNIDDGPNNSNPASSQPGMVKLIGHSAPVSSVAFDPIAGASDRPRFLLSASFDGTVRLWSLDTMSNVVVFRGHRGAVWDVQWGPRGIYFATAGRDRTAALWTCDRTHMLRLFVGHLADVNRVAFHPNSLYLATTSADRTARLWDVQTGKCVRVFASNTAGLGAVAFSNDGRYLATASDDFSIYLWDIASGALLHRYTGHTSSVTSLSFSAESSILVSGALDNSVGVWDVHAASTEHACLAVYFTKNTAVHEVAFTHKNLCLAIGVLQS